MKNLLTITYNNLPTIGGASGAVIDATRHNIFNSLGDLLVYIGYAAIGALVGYGVKAILDIFNTDRKIANLRERLKKFDEDIKKKITKKTISYESNKNYEKFETIKDEPIELNEEETLVCESCKYVFIVNKNALIPMSKQILKGKFYMQAMGLQCPICSHISIYNK